MKLEKFLTKLSAPNDRGCRIWLGGKNRRYGKTWHNGKTVVAHRLMYELVHGPFPPEIKILHRCDNPPCCEITHLQTGSQQDNIRDRDAKKRTYHPHGSKNQMSKLTEEIVIDIRRKYKIENHSKESLMSEYNVTRHYLNKLLRGACWAHVA